MQGLRRGVGEILMLAALPVAAMSGYRRENKG
jgi:hypothetical protein